MDNQNFNWMRLRPLYLLISSVVLIVGLVSFVSWGFELGVEFTGGTNVEYKFENEVSTDEVSQKLKERGVETQSVQKSGEQTYILKLGAIDQAGQDTLKTTLQEVGGENSQLLQFEQVGPSVSTELVKKTLFAILISAGAILGWIAYQFKSIKFGISATVATFHDALLVLGLFSLFGHLFGAEIDFLFVTALLTILSFSVHDTIVVYDRIREIRRKNSGAVVDIANRALSETMRRSVFNSLVIIIMLVSLIALGGESMRWFAVALLVGTIAGTYSSPFVAVPILVTWDQLQKRQRPQEVLVDSKKKL